MTVSLLLSLHSFVSYLSPLQLSSSLQFLPPETVSLPLSLLFGHQPIASPPTLHPPPSPTSSPSSLLSVFLSFFLLAVLLPTALHSLPSFHSLRYALPLASSPSLPLISSTRLKSGNQRGAVGGEWRRRGAARCRVTRHKGGDFRRGD